MREMKWVRKKYPFDYTVLWLCWTLCILYVNILIIDMFRSSICFTNFLGTYFDTDEDLSNKSIYRFGSWKNASRTK